MSNDSSSRIKSIFSLIAIIAVSCLILFGAVLPSLQKDEPADCTALQKYDSNLKKCVAKTPDERRVDEKAKEEQTRKNRLEKEIADGKKNGSVCLTAAESWRNIGKKTCVVFHPSYLYRTGSGYLFLDEKVDYKNGFVAFFVYRNMMSWNTFTAKYGSVNLVAVSGEISSYQGHPQIKVYDLNQVTSPKLINCETSYGCVYSR